MSRYSNPRLLTPPREEEEVYPYRRVWPSLVFEVGLLFGVTFGVFFLWNFLGIRVGGQLRQLLSLGLILLPAVLWVVFSRWQEGRVPEPRRRLAAVFVISALVANAIGIPIINFLAPDRWLAFGETIGRLIGYTVTVGVVHETLKYLILRFTVWPDGIRTRLDAVAYMAAASAGYVTVLNLNLLTVGITAPDVIAGRVFANMTVHLAASVVVAYGMAEVRFNRRSLLLLPMTLVIGCIVHGLGVSARPNIVNAGFVLGIAATRPLFGFVFNLIIVVGVLSSMAFLFSTREREEYEATTNREDDF